MTVTGSDRADDLALVRRCGAGDEEAWNHLVERYRQGMIDLAVRILPHVAAQDVVDTVIADVWERRKLASYEGRSSLATWLGAVTINAALNARRAIGARAHTAAAADKTADGLAPAFVDRDEAGLVQILNEAIAALPAESRLLVLMYYEQGLTLDQAAVLLKRSKSTLSRSLQQARDAIRHEADRLAHERLRTTLDALRAGTDLGQLDLDLRAACARGRNRLER